MILPLLIRCGPSRVDSAVSEKFAMSTVSVISSVLLQQFLASPGGEKCKALIAVLSKYFLEWRGGIVNTEKVMSFHDSLCMGKFAGHQKHRGQSSSPVFTCAKDLSVVTYLSTGPHFHREEFLQLYKEEKLFH